MVSMARPADATKTSVGGICRGRTGVGAQVRASSTDPVVLDIFSLGFVAVKD